MQHSERPGGWGAKALWVAALGSSCGGASGPSAAARLRFARSSLRPTSHLVTPFGKQLGLVQEFAHHRFGGVFGHLNRWRVNDEQDECSLRVSPDPGIHQVDLDAV